MKPLLLFILSIISSSLLYSNEPYQFKDVGITNRIGAQITQNIVLTDEYDTEVNLMEIISDKPVINFVYLNCPLLYHLLRMGYSTFCSKAHIR